ncbi:uncharacterized protein [Drosophila pseudoobscura]|uniref:Uncharacterized protein n=1 Tax=Drosophila pseudoobscura pseudoobscura TaxID=46245 RepID=A0A6I8VFD3_DROPS|nr:uncharacterized protein LOC26532023 [Drosophila pseudoobscura]
MRKSREPSNGSSGRAITWENGRERARLRMANVIVDRCSACCGGEQEREIEEQTADAAQALLSIDRTAFWHSLKLYVQVNRISDGQRAAPLESVRVSINSFVSQNATNQLKPSRPLVTSMESVIESLRQSKHRLGRTPTLLSVSVVEAARASAVQVKDVVVFEWIYRRIYNR